MTPDTATTAERPLAYPRDAVLSRAEVAAWLRVSEKTVYRMGIKQTPQHLYLAAWVYDYLEEAAA